MRIDRLRMRQVDLAPQELPQLSKPCKINGGWHLLRVASAPCPYQRLVVDALAEVPIQRLFVRY